MICRDFMLRVCCRNPCKMHHEVKMCTNPSCNANKLCKLVHNLTMYELPEINENIRPFRQNIYNEMKRLAFILRETFPLHLRTHACTLYMLGECMWPCLMCGTASSNGKFFEIIWRSYVLFQLLRRINRNIILFLVNNRELVCNKCYIPLSMIHNIESIDALFCGHVYCKYCIDRLPIEVDGHALLCLALRQMW